MGMGAAEAMARVRATPVDKARVKALTTPVDLQGRARALALVHRSGGAQVTRRPAALGPLMQVLVLRALASPIETAFAKPSLAAATRC